MKKILQKNIVSLHAVAAAVTCWTAQPALAQDASANASLTTVAEEASDSDVAPGEIIVTAQRRSQSLQRVPVSVTVVSGASLQEGNITKLEDLSARMPNLKIATAPASDQLRIRGAGSGFNPGFEQSVATFIDGQYFGRSRSSRVALFDIDRVEVLKGPQTTFFGANAIAGALNITTRKPGSTLEVNGSALYTPSIDEYALETGVSVPVTDTLSTRFAVKASGMGGYVTLSRTGEKGPHLDDWQGRASVNWRPSSVFELDAKLDLASLRDSNVFATQLVGCPPPVGVATGRCAAALAANGGSIDDRLDYRSDVGDGGRSNINLTLFSLTPRLHLGNVDLIAITGYYDQKATVVSDIAPFPGLSPTGTTTHAPSYTDERTKDFSQELRLQSTGGGPLDWMVGGYYERQELSITSMLGRYFTNLAARAPGLVANNSPIAYLGFFDQTTNTYSAFANIGYQITPRLQLSGGLRYSSVHKRASASGSYGIGTSELSPTNFTPVPAAAQPLIEAGASFPRGGYANPSRTDDAFMYSATAQYELSGTQMMYAKYTRGFKAGGFAVSSTASFDPEYVDAYEAGIKSSFIDRRLTTSLALFSSVYKGLQDSQNISTGTATVFVIRNVGKSASRGVEGSINYRISPALTIGADAAYLDSHYVSYTGATCDPVMSSTIANCQQDLSGRRLPFAPKWSGSAHADLDLPLSSGTSLIAGGTLYFTSAYYLQSAITDLVKQDGNAKIDARIGIRFAGNRFTASIIGKNLTDRTTASYINYTPGGVGTVTKLVDPPRTISFQLSFRY